MCVYSMVMDRGIKELQPYLIQPVPISTPAPTPNPWVTTVPFTISPFTYQQDMDALKAKVDMLEKLLEDAQKYDRDNGEPDCELDSKKKILRELADKLKIKISIPE
jgi:hypothetical protein